MPEKDWLMDELERRGVSRRDFLGFCSVTASALALPASVGAKIADAIETKEKPTLVWLVVFAALCGYAFWVALAGRPMFGSGEE